jgi:hypothetical protein
MVEKSQTEATGMGERMNENDQDGKSGPVLEELRIPTQVKLAGLWAAVMFMYVYVDIFGFFRPGIISDILAGRVYVFDITQTWLVSSLVLMTLPSLMVYLSLVMPARANRYANIGLAAVYMIIILGLAAGESWAYYVIGSVVEAVLLAQVVWTAWRWPQVPRQSAAVAVEGAVAG